MDYTQGDLMNIKILGSGCSRCKILEEIFRKVVSELKISADIEHIHEIEKFADYGAMTTPAAVINNELVVEGRIPTENEVREIVQRYN